MELFFCVSGYVIVGTLRRAKSPAAFLEDRAIRIYPVLAVTVLTVVGLGLLTRAGQVSHVAAAELLWLMPVNLLGLPGIFPFDCFHPAAWSLSYELAFYALCAAGWALRRRLGAALPWLAVPVLAAMLVFVPLALFFGPGVLVAAGWPRGSALRRLTAYPLPALMLFLACFQGMEVLSPGLLQGTSTLIDCGWEGQLLVAAAFVLGLFGFAGLVAGRGGFAAFLRARPLLYLGTISYSFYLWHPIVLSGVK